MKAKPTTLRSRSSILLEFLGSMNLAITILVAIAVASVIGTVLQQNQPYQSYIIKFGPFWHEVYKALGLYDVYSAPWFLVLLGFLVVSTSVCIYRNGPTMLRDMRQFRTNVQEKSLRVMRNQRAWDTPADAAQVEGVVNARLQREGYRLRRKEQGGGVLLAGMKGGANRLGYLLTHVGIVVICIGGLIDGNLSLRWKEWTGQIQIETRDIAASQVPEHSRLKPSDSLSFRGSVTVPEGAVANLVFLNLRDGYLLQELPFAVELKDFRIEHYPSGQPKSFESDLVIHDDQLEAPLETTIAVNHPLIYRGYAIYQASFGDGGSRLALQAWPLHSPQLAPEELAGIVHRDLRVQTADGPLNLEFTDFQQFNIFPAPEGEASGRKFINFGPSFTYKARDAAGNAREYLNYMAPVLQDGRYFFLTGVRGTPNEEFRFLHIPVDAKASPERFLRYRALLQDRPRVHALATAQTAQAMGELRVGDRDLQADVVASMERLVALFNEGGLAAIGEQVQASAPPERQQQVLEAYFKVLENILQTAYVELLTEEGVDLSQGVQEAEAVFFEDAINALSGIGLYDSPFYLQLAGFEHVEASGLQIARAPGKNVVYLGCVMLIVGIFFMFYISHRRLWALIKPEDGVTRVVLAGAGNRNQHDFEREFAALSDALRARLPQGGHDGEHPLPETRPAAANEKRPSHVGT